MGGSIGKVLRFSEQDKMCLYPYGPFETMIIILPRAEARESCGGTWRRGSWGGLVKSLKTYEKPMVFDGFSLMKTSKKPNDFDGLATPATGGPMKNEEKNNGFWLVFAHENL